MTKYVCYQYFHHLYQWHIQRYFRNTVFSRGFQARSPKGHNCDLWRIIFNYKNVWMEWVGVIYYGKLNYDVFINCLRHCVKGKFIQNYNLKNIISLCYYTFFSVTTLPRDSVTKHISKTDNEKHTSKIKFSIKFFYHIILNFVFALNLHAQLHWYFISQT